MSQQSSLNRYFKTKASSSFTSPLNSVPNMSDKDKKKKRRSLSLIKPTTPKKSPKLNDQDTSIDDIIDLCGDDENITSTPIDTSHNISQSSVSSEAKSESTVLYSLTPRTPLKTPTSSTSNSPRTDQYFSPTKKRLLVKRSLVTRNLARESFGIQPVDTEVDEVFVAACQGMDDKTVFLLNTINKCLKDASLKKLLDETSQKHLSQCLHVVKPGMRLVCRLYWCQNRWYRRAELARIINNKEELGDPQLQEIINSLVGCELITSASETNMLFEECTKILNSDELKQICKHLKLKIKTKQDATEALKVYSQQASISKYFTGSTSDNSERVLRFLRQKAGPCYKLSEAARLALHKLYILMYLGMDYSIMRDKKLELLLINDKTKRETYPIDKTMVLDDASVVFQASEEFTRYVDAHGIYEKFLEATDTGEKCGTVKNIFQLYKNISEEDMTRYRCLPTWLRRFTPAYIYVKILESGVQDLKRMKSLDYYQSAVEILSILIKQNTFRVHKKAEWYAEKALILHRHMPDSHDEAAKVLLDGFNSSMHEQLKDSMRPRAKLIANQQNIALSTELRQALLSHALKDAILEKNFPADHIYKQHMDGNKRGKKKFEVYNQDGWMAQEAEDYCITHYLMNGDFTHGEHWEGRIITTIYFLFFWDIIYTKPVGVSGIFLSHYQMYPLDMFTEYFYSNRKTLIDERLATIEQYTDDILVAALLKTWDERPETELSVVSRGVSRECVRGVCAALGARAVAALCRRLSQHYGYAHSGFPDLTLWNEHTKKIKFVEVKTDTDKPSMKQIQWMQYLRENRIDTGFCYVGVNTTRSKARAGASLAATNNTESCDISDGFSDDSDFCNDALDFSKITPELIVVKPEF